MKLSRRRRGWGALVAFCGLYVGAAPSACRSKSTPAPTPEASQGTGGGGSLQSKPGSGALGILYADVVRTPAAPPARFMAPLPLPAEFKEFRSSSRFPPPSHVADRVCSGDAEMQGRLLDALRRAVAGGASAERLRETYGSLLRFRSERPLCELAERVVAGAVEPAPVRELFWEILAGCDPSPAAQRLFRRAEVPARALVKHVSELQWAHPATPVDAARLAGAVEEVIRTDPLEARVAAFVLARVEDPRALEALLRLHERLSDPQGRLDIAFALKGKADPRARALAEAACREQPRDPVCQPPALSEAAGAVPPSALAGAESADVPRVVREYAKRPEELLGGLERCARENPRSYLRRECLAHLAVADRRRASGVARDLSRGLPDDDPHLLELVTTLVRFPGLADFESFLRSVGIQPASGAVVPGEPPVLTVRDHLERNGQARSFDAETGQFPNEHDSLLRRLAALAGSDLPAVLFEEIPPKLEEERSESAPPEQEKYTLVAFVAGERLSVQASDLGDWYDVDAVLGLLNVIARDARADARFAALSTGDQFATVVALPEGTLRKLQEDGLLAFGSGSSAMHVGKAFEAEVIKRLQQQPDKH